MATVELVNMAMVLKDGRRFFVHGWHEYTGWDCQSGAEYQEIVNP